MMDPKECSSSQETGAIYQTKRVKFLGLDVLFILQNDAGPCPLLAICKLFIDVINKLNISLKMVQGLGFYIARFYIWFRVQGFTLQGSIQEKNLMTHISKPFINSNSRYVGYASHQISAAFLHMCSCIAILFWVSFSILLLLIDMSCKHSRGRSCFCVKFWMFV